jgi:serine/threonine-protein kinase
MPAAVIGPIPRQLGRYEVIDRLAIGGMAEVFVCCERGLGGLERLAVVKRILPQLSVHAAFIEMFLAEARYVARLNHPNVVQVFELAEDEQHAPFLAMEYIAGNSIRELIVAAIEKDQRTPIGAAVGMIVQACAGAHAAHELADSAGRPLGLVHRDISPHNLMVTGEGHVKLLDFGIAKATETAFADDHTRTGGLKGKVHYMSPEQCKQHPLDRRSDVFALGIVLWETLAQERLFRRGSELEAMQAITGGERKDLSKIRSDVPRELLKILERALAPAKEDRFTTADEMRKALLDACALHHIACGADEVAAFVRPLLGESQKRRQADLLQRAQAEEPTKELRPPPEPKPPPPPPAKTPPVRARRTGWVPVRAAGGLAPPITASGRTIVPMMILFGLALGIVVAMIELVFRSGPPLVLAFPPTADAKLMLEDAEPLREHLEDALDRPVTIAIASSYQDLQDRLLDGKLELAALPPYLYVETKEKDPRIELIATKVVEDSTGNDSILYVSQTSNITDIAGLKGKRFCFPDHKSTTGYLFPRLALRKAGLDPDRDIVEQLSGSHMQSLRDLVNGACDAAATYSGGFLAADRSGIPVARIKQLAIIGRSPHEAMVVPANMPEPERRRIQAALFAFKPADGGKSGRVERISGFRTGEQRDYDAVREALSGGRDR